jgi:hypothetical protein
MPFRLAVLALLLPLPLDAQSSSEEVRVEVQGAARVFRAADLRALPQDTIRARAHGGPDQVFVGPTLAAILTSAGARLDSLRGRALAQYLTVEARDGYRVVFAVAELSAAFTSRRVILAHTADGRPLAAADGPWRVVSEGEQRPARWVRQVSALLLRDAPR